MLGAALVNIMSWVATEIATGKRQLNTDDFLVPRQTPTSGGVHRALTNTDRYMNIWGARALKDSIHDKLFASMSSARLLWVVALVCFKL